MDNDPLVLVHARALLTGSPEGATDYLGADLHQPARILEAAARTLDTGAVPYQLRTPEEIASFFDGLELVEPGIVSCPRWRPDPGAEPADVDAFGGVGRKP